MKNILRKIETKVKWILFTDKEILELEALIKRYDEIIATFGH